MPLVSNNILKGSQSIKEMETRWIPKGLYSRAYFSKNTTVHVIGGPEASLFTVSSLEAFYSCAFVVSADISRVGYRLTGPPIHTVTHNIASKTTFPGIIQIPPSGDPIILMADGPVTGGYLRIGVVAEVDLPILAQLRPGGRVRFLECLPEKARLREINQCRLIEELYYKKNG